MKGDDKMKHLTITGKIKTSVEDLKNSLYQKMNYEPTIINDSTNNLNFKGYISISSNDDYTVNDILSILVKHCMKFKLEVDENDYYDSRYTSPYFIKSTYFTRDGKNLNQRFKDFFGTTDEIVNWNHLISGDENFLKKFKKILDINF